MLGGALSPSWRSQTMGRNNRFSKSNNFKGPVYEYDVGDIMQIAGLKEDKNMNH